MHSDGVRGLGFSAIGQKLANCLLARQIRSSPKQELYFSPYPNLVRVTPSPRKGADGPNPPNDPATFSFTPAAHGGCRNIYQMGALIRELVM